MTYIHSVDDIDRERSEMAFSALNSVGINSIAIASNQMGVGSGYLSLDALDSLTLYVTGLANFFDITISELIFATHRNSNIVTKYSDNLQRSKERVEAGFNADKPDIGMLVRLLRPSKKIMYIGDAHVMGRSEDVAMVRRAISIGMDVVYVPVECLLEFAI